MRKNIKLPAPQLSQLKEVNIDLDMTGRHYAQLATSEGQLPEEVALSILKDLVEEDANKLTMSEMRYLFMLVKINSLENDYTVGVECTHDGCHHHNNFKVRLSDADLNPCPKNYKIPKINFRTEETEKEYSVIPPTMDMEIALFNWFLNVKNKTLDDIADDKETALNFTFIRACMHLVDKSGIRLIQDITDFEPVLKFFDSNKYQTINKLYSYMNEVDSFGVQNKIYSIKCEECGGTLVFQLPLLNGLSS